jgi:hypothetical protein
MKGYWLIHSGNVIYEVNCGDDYIVPYELKFIDDTTGFFIENDASYGSFTIYKIINDSVVDIGFIPAIFLKTFVVSRHTIYVMTWADNPDYDYFFIRRCSDLADEKSLLSMDTIIPDTTFHDTVFGLPLCQGLNRLDCLYKHGNDTMDYVILFKTDTLESIPQHEKSGFTIVPNPASDFIRIITPSNEKFKSIILLDNLGRKRKCLSFENTREKVLYIGDLDIGVYFVILEYEDAKRVQKLIKI